MFETARQDNKVLCETNKQLKCGKAHLPPPQQHLSTWSVEVFAIQLNKVASTGNTTPATSGMKSLGWGFWRVCNFYLHIDIELMDLHRLSTSGVVGICFSTKALCRRFMHFFYFARKTEIPDSVHDFILLTRVPKDLRGIGYSAISHRGFTLSCQFFQGFVNQCIPKDFMSLFSVSF